MKLTFNKSSMIRNGTVSLITMILIGGFLGKENIMIAFPVALTSAVLSRQNIKVKFLSKIMLLVMVDVIIVLVSYISTLNIFMGVLVDLIAIFLIVYCLMSIYDFTFYKPFLMLYIFTQYSKIPIRTLPSRILATIFGILIIAIINLIKTDDEKDLLENDIKKSLRLIQDSLVNLVEDKYNKELSQRYSKLMRVLAYKIYITRHHKYFTTIFGGIQFEIYMNLGYLNIYLDEINAKYKMFKVERNDVENIIKTIECLILFIESKIEYSDLEELIKKLELCNNKHINEVAKIIRRILKNVITIKEMNKREINKVYELWERASFDTFRVSIKKYFYVGNIRFRFAMRMSIILSISILIAKILGYYKIIWLLITIMSIIQPYYEDTRKKAMDRIIGNVIGILFTGSIIRLVDNKIIIISILVVSLYLLYGFKEYYMISLFASIASICISSLTADIYVLLFYRVVYVILGVLVVLVGNRYIFSYKVENGIKDLIYRIYEFNKVLIKDSINVLNGNIDDVLGEVRDIIIHISLMEQKLYMRNIQYKSEEIEKIINNNNKYIIGMGYSILNNRTIDRLLLEQFYKHNEERLKGSIKSLKEMML